MKLHSQIVKGRSINMKNNQPNKKYNEHDVKLAQRILCATLSVQMRISYQHCWKTYIEPNLQENEIETLYLECAKIIRESVTGSVMKNAEAPFSGLTP